MRIVWGILLVLFIFAVLVFLMSSVVSMGIKILDPVAKLDIWNSPLWTKIRIPAIVVAVVLGVALLISFSVRSESKAEKALKEFALSNGWGYATKSGDSDGAVARVEGGLEKVCFEKKFDVQTVMTVQEVGRIITLFSCLFRERNSTTTRTNGSGCLIQSQRFPAMAVQTNILRRSPIDGALLPKQVDVGDSEFTRAFIVQSKDPETARKVITDTLRAALLSQWSDSAQSPNGIVEIAVGPGGAVVLRYNQVKPDEWLVLLELARRVESSM